MVLGVPILKHFRVYTFSSKEIQFLNILTWELLMFVMACLVASGLVVRASDMDSKNISLIFFSVSLLENMQMKGCIIDKYTCICFQTFHILDQYFVYHRFSLFSNCSSF